MGTKQYGDEASESKRNRKKLKVNTSTSGKLGLRIAGMQVGSVQV